MPDCLLKLTSVPTAGDYVRACWHVYYGAFYVGIIRPCAGERWRVWLHGVAIGEFGSLVEAKRAITECYYGPGV